jgi:hypothetical protein
VLLFGLTPPVVGPLLAVDDEPLEVVLLGAEALADPPVAAEDELVVGVVAVEDAAP